MKEDRESWKAFLTGLKERGLTGTQLFIEDKCLGLLDVGTVKDFSKIQELLFGIRRQSAGGGFRLCSVQVFHTHAAFCSP